MARYWNALLSCMVPSFGLVRCEVVERPRCLVVRSVGGELGLAAYVLLRVERFGKLLRSKVLVPRLGKRLVLLV